MRPLIYLVSFGAGYRRFTQMALNSIREVGRWPHDIVVLSDDGTPFDRGDATVIDILPDLQRRYPWFAGTTGMRMGHCKAEIEFHVDLDRYDYVLYLDSDLLVNRNGLVELVAALSREARAAVQRDAVPVLSGASVAGGWVLTPEERAAWAHYQVNSGVVGLPVNAQSRRILRDWRRMNVAARFQSRDQGNLIAVLLRRNFGQWAYVEDATLAGRLERYDETLVHFAGEHKHTIMQTYYEQTLGLAPVRA
jgi:hypothetical protein